MSPTGRSFKVLCVGSHTAETSSLASEFQSTGCDVSIVHENEGEALRRALDESNWDAVILGTEQSLKRAADALELVRGRLADVPVFVLDLENASPPSAEASALSGLAQGMRDLKFVSARELVARVSAPQRDAVRAGRRSDSQEQLVLVDRMSTVGALAAGVAHEINNRLAALMMNLEFVSQDVTKLSSEVTSAAEPGSSTAENDARAWIHPSLEQIQASITDARESAVGVQRVARDLRVFSHAADDRIVAVEVRRPIESALRMAWNEIRHRARLVKDYGDVPRVSATEARLAQVFLNLVLHAARSIPEGHAEENEIRIVTRREEGPVVLIEVHDSGPGVPDHLLPHVFEPFFSPDPQSSGSGYGLTICQRLVVALDGTIDVENRPDGGTVFRIRLPAAKRVPLSAPKLAATGPASARSKILIVDDDVTFGEAIRRMLGADHDVMVLHSARDVLSRLARGECFDAILCDLMMPDMSGTELHDEVVARYPEYARKMVFMTGGAFTPQALKFLSRVENPCLEKPFDASAVRVALAPFRPRAPGDPDLAR